MEQEKKDTRDKSMEQETKNAGNESVKQEKTKQEKTKQEKAKQEKTNAPKEEKASPNPDERISERDRSLLNKLILNKLIDGRMFQGDAGGKLYENMTYGQLSEIIQGIDNDKLDRFLKTQQGEEFSRRYLDDLRRLNPRMSENARRKIQAILEKEAMKSRILDEKYQERRREFKDSLHKTKEHGKEILRDMARSLDL